MKRVSMLAGWMMLTGVVAAQDGALRSEVAGGIGGFHVFSGGQGASKWVFTGSGAAKAGTKGQVFGEFSLVPLSSYSSSGSGDGYSYSGSSSSKMYNAVAGYRYHFPLRERVLPYVTGFGGYTAARSSSDFRSTAGEYSGSYTSSASVHGGLFGFGGGVRWRVGERWGLRPELRYQRHQYSGGGTNVMVVTVSAFYEFGK